MDTHVVAIACLLSSAFAHQYQYQYTKNLRQSAVTNSTARDLLMLSGAIHPEDSARRTTQRVIPDRLLFNDKVLEKGFLFPIVGIMSQNVKHLVTLFPDIHEIEYLDNQGCSAAIEAAHSKELATYFNNEQTGMYKSDICRLAQLFLHGGYYMDNDLNLRQDPRELLPPQVSFASVLALDQAVRGDEMFQAFLAAAPRHPIILLAMNKCLEYYQQQKPRMGLHGTQVLGKAYAEYMHQPMAAGLQESAKAKGFKYAYFFKEAASDSTEVRDWNIPTSADFNFHKDKEYVACNVLVVDQAKHKVLGFSHAVGSHSCKSDCTSVFCQFIKGLPG